MLNDVFLHYAAMLLYFMLYICIYFIAYFVPLSHPDIFKKNKWTGKNLLGECLMSVRDQLRA